MTRHIYIESRKVYDTMNHEEAVTVAVDMPPDLLYDLDEYATRHGYESHSDLVRRALDVKLDEE